MYTRARERRILLIITHALEIDAQKDDLERIPPENRRHFINKSVGSSKKIQSKIWTMKKKAIPLPTTNNRHKFY